MNRLMCTSAASCAALALALGSTPTPVPAAGPGLGYDMVMKFHASQDSDAPAAPGSFSTDFATASTPVKTSSGHMPFGLGKLVAAAQNVGSMFKNGTATRHYYGSTKFREDNLALQTGDITDCTARTLTHLDFNAKTYHVTSLDQPEPSAAPDTGHHQAEPEPASTDDGTKYTVDLTTKALGAMTIDGVPTRGYDMNIKMTATKPSGESSTSNEDLESYYSAMAEPVSSCPAREPRTMPGGGAGMGAALAQMALAMQALNAKGNSRFKVTSSGPPVPGGKLAMWSLMTMKGSSSSDASDSHGALSIETERGNVHTLSDSDPAFGIPEGYTKVL